MPVYTVSTDLGMTLLVHAPAEPERIGSAGRSACEMTVHAAKELPAAPTRKTTAASAASKATPGKDRSATGKVATATKARRPRIAAEEQADDV